VVADDLQLQIWKVVFEMLLKMGEFQPGDALVTVPLLLPAATVPAAARDRTRSRASPPASGQRP